MIFYNIDRFQLKSVQIKSNQSLKTLTKLQKRELSLPKKKKQKKTKENPLS